MKLIFEDAPDNLYEYLDSITESVDILKSVEVGKLDFPIDDSPESRWNQLKWAAKGARLYSNVKRVESPLYAGPLPKNGNDIQIILADLNYTKQQLEYMSQFGVTYIGRIQTDPRNLLVLDHKKASARHDTYLSEALSAILTASPADWWGSLGIVSAGNADKLQAFLNATADAIPFCYSSGAAAKLKYSGREFVLFDDPASWTKKAEFHGMELRGLTNDLSKKLALEETQYGKPQAIASNELTQ
jgi:hypothetical protein